MGEQVFVGSGEVVNAVALKMLIKQGRVMARINNTDTAIVRIIGTAGLALQFQGIDPVQVVPTHRIAGMIEAQGRANVIVETLIKRP